MATLQPQRIVILGGGYAGMLAAARMVRHTGLNATLIDAKPHFVHRFVQSDTVAGSPPCTLPYAPLLRRRGIQFVQGYVEAIEPMQQRVIGRDHEGNSLDLGYDYLIVALGSRTAASVPGVATHTLRLNDLDAIQRAHVGLHDIAQRGGRVLVVGGGLSGIETATEIAERVPGLRITLATCDAFGTEYSDRGVRHLRQRFAQLGIDLHEHTTITSVQNRAAETTQGELPFDLCIWAGGFEAQPLARDAGLRVDNAGRIVVDPLLRAVDHRNIFAVGDAAAVAQHGRTLPMACATAMPMGAYVGDTIRGLLRDIEPQPFALDFVARCVSLGRRDGLLQWTQPDDQPRPKVWQQRSAVLMKELICRATVGVVQNELRWGVPLLRWAQSGQTQGHLLTGEQLQ